MSSAWRRLTTSLVDRPRTWAIGAGVGVTAVLTGVLVSVAIAGRIYRPATAPIDRVTLEIYDPVTDARETSTSLAGHHGYCVVGSRALVYIVDMVMLAAYDPTTDAWSSPITTPSDRDCIGAGFGPDGRLYLASMWGGADIMAWDGSTQAWLSVEPPPAAQGFRPRFVTAPDGHLWAIDPDTSFVFVPPSR